MVKVLKAQWTQFPVGRVWVLEGDPHSLHLEQQMGLWEDYRAHLSRQGFSSVHVKGFSICVLLLVNSGGPEHPERPVDTQSPGPFPQLGL